LEVRAAWHDSGNQKDQPHQSKQPTSQSSPLMQRVLDQGAFFLRLHPCHRKSFFGNRFLAADLMFDLAQTMQIIDRMERLLLQSVSAYQW
jgi:hypothetical protein